MGIPYINYLDMKKFYTIHEVCTLFIMEKETLRKDCEQYGVDSRRNEIGEYGVSVQLK